MAGSRIFFAGNPWPEGHPIKTFEWSARLRNGEVWFDFHLESEDYDSERPIDDDGVEYQSDWEAPIVWNNYHACTLSTNFWHEGGFPTGLGSLAALASMDRLELVVDSPPPDDSEDNAFHVYLLGHDAAAEHRIRFSRIPGTDRFNIDWTGRLALAYVGDHEYKHSFTASLLGIQAPSSLLSS